MKKERTVIIDDNQFLIGDKRLPIISGEFHFWRVPGLVPGRKYKYKNFQCQTFQSIYAEFITV